MDIKTEIVALAVRIAAQKGFVRKPGLVEELISSFLGEETYDVRQARKIVTHAEKVIAKRQQHKLKKQIQQETKTLFVSSERVD